MDGEADIVAAEDGAEDAVGLPGAHGRARVEREGFEDHGLGARRQAGEQIARRVRDFDLEAWDFVAGVALRRVRDGLGVRQVGFDVIERRAVQQVHPA